MNDRLERINSFLCMLKDISAENKDFYWDTTKVYQLLIKLGVKEDDKKKHIVCDENFDYWTERNNKDFRSNLRCFVDSQWSYFCQFMSKEQYKKISYGNPDDNYYKLYIPLDKEHIRNGADLLFDYIKQNNIEHLSKIGADVRFDDIVVRLTDKKDVEKIIDFVGSNEYLKEGLVKPNPFLYSKNNVAVACDGDLSFNITVSSLISNYINDKKINNKLKEINVDDFYEYACDIYNDIFVKKIYNEEKIKEMFPKVDSRKKILDLKGILNILLNSANKDFDLNKYFEEYDKINNPINDLGVKILSDSECQALIDKGLKLLAERFNSYSTAIHNMISYVEEMHDKYITSKDGLRDLFNSLNFDLQLKDFFKRNNIDVKNFFAEKRNKYVKDSFSRYKATDILYITRSVLFAMNSKYGSYQAKNALEDYIEVGYSDGITRQFEGREIRSAIVNSNYRQVVKEILKEINIDAELFIDSVFNTIISKEDYLYNAMTLTYEKFGLGNVGKTQVKNAICKIIRENNYDGFTRDKNARIDLIDNVSRDDLIKFICDKLSCTPIDIEQNLDEICETYVSELTDIFGFAINK